MRALMPAWLPLMFASASLLDGPTIFPGVHAPELSVDHWIKGRPVRSVDGDRAYVVEFWTSGSPASLGSLAHLAELAKKQRDVTFVAVSIWEDDRNMAVEKFVDQMGLKTPLRVAYGGNQSGVAQSWVAASGQKTLPVAFIVKGGAVQWIGPAKDIGTPLSQAITGTANVSSNKAAFMVGLKEGGADVTDRAAAMATIANMLKAGQNKQAHATMDKLVAAHPELKTLGNETSLFWLAAEKPVTFEAGVDRLLAKGDLASRNKVFGAVVMMAEEPALRDLTVATMQKLQKTAKPDDIATAYAAVQIYAKVKDSGQETMAAKQGLQILDAKKASANSPLRSYFKKAIAGK